MTSWQRNYTETTGWVHYKEPAPRVIKLLRPNMHPSKIITQRPIKLRKPIHASLFNLIHPDILADIDIWLSVLEYRDKFKHIILRSKYMSNPVLFSINAEYWNPHHNFEAFRWYNIIK